MSWYVRTGSPCWPFTPGTPRGPPSPCTNIKHRSANEYIACMHEVRDEEVRGEGVVRGDG